MLDDMLDGPGMKYIGEKVSTFKFGYSHYCLFLMMTFRTAPRAAAERRFRCPLE